MMPQGSNICTGYSHELHVRFSEKVAFGGFSDCWLWKAATNVAKHSPAYRWGVVGAWGRTMKASRLSWMLNRGDIPPGFNVLHLCDNPMCVNPGHLYLGTQRENVDDMDRRGRRRNAQVTGDRHANAKLSADDVVVIRAASEPAPALARRYGVSREQIRNIQTFRQRKNG